VTLVVSIDEKFAYHIEFGETSRVRRSLQSFRNHLTRPSTAFDVLLCAVCASIYLCLRCTAVSNPSLRYVLATRFADVANSAAVQGIAF